MLMVLDGVGDEDGDMSANRERERDQSKVSSAQQWLPPAAASHHHAKDCLEKWH